MHETYLIYPVVKKSADQCIILDDFICAIIYANLMVYSVAKKSTYLVLVQIQVCLKKIVDVTL